MQYSVVGSNAGTKTAAIGICLRHLFLTRAEEGNGLIFASPRAGRSYVLLSTKERNWTRHQSAITADKRPRKAVLSLNQPRCTPYCM